MEEPMSLREKLPLRFEKIKNGHFRPKDLDYPLHLYLKDNDITVQEKGSEIVNFLKGKHVLVTGATGFLGKMLVEKLLRSSQDITVYVIVREKKGKQISDRISEMENSYVFHKLRKINPFFIKNIVGVNGDISKPGLGLSEESRELLKKNINLIYHAAASIRFDEQLRKAVHTNILGTNEIIKLAKECKHIEALTHVSTAYSNCNFTRIEEKFYEPVVSSDILISLINSFPDKILDGIAPGLLGGLPNTYTLTKQSSEDLIKNKAVGIPTCICRPSIVVSSWKEPLKCWGDNLFGPIGFMLAVGLGLVHVVKGDHNKKPDVVPVDFVINHCIAASYKTAVSRDVSNIPIYNCTAGKYALPWKSLGRLMNFQANSYGCTKSIMPYFLIYTPNELLVRVLRIVLHRIPAYVFDCAAVCIRKKPQLMKAYDKLDKFADVLSFFTSNEFDFKNSNTKILWGSLNEVDKNYFNFNFESVNWDEYYTVFMIALREYVLRDFLDTVDEGRTHFRRLQIGFLTIVAVLAFVVMYIFYKIFVIIF